MTSGSQIDLNTIISYMMLIMIVGVMMKMMTRAVEEPEGLKPLYVGKVPLKFKPVEAREIPPALKEEYFYKPALMFTRRPETAEEWERLGGGIKASGIYTGIEDIDELVREATMSIPEYGYLERAEALAVRGEARRRLLWFGERSGCYKEAGHSSPVRRYGEPRTEAERAEVHEEFYGPGELYPRGTGLSERGESAEGRGLGYPKTEAEREETHERRYGTRETPERGRGRMSPELYWRITDLETGEIFEKNLPYSNWAKVKRAAVDFAVSRSKYAGEYEVKIEVFDIPEATSLSLDEQTAHRLYEGYLRPPSRTLEEHHSIHGPERQHLVDLYGSWSVGRAEAVCPTDDVVCVEREAARLLGAYRRAYTYE